MELVASSAASIALESSESYLAVKGTGGTEFSTITATLRDSRGQLVPVGTSVNFKVSPDGTFSNGQDSTTVLAISGGQAVVVYQSGTTSGTKIFTVDSGLTATSSAVLVLVNAGPAVQIVIGSESGLIANSLNNGLTTTVLGAFVADTYSNPIAEGTEVFFELTGANADTADITTVMETDDTGVATATITYPDDATGVAVTVRVTVGTVTETQTIILP